MNVVLFDEEAAWKSFLPLTFTRPVSELRIGILTIKEKWDFSLSTSCSYLSQNYLSKKFQLQVESGFFINASVCPSDNLIAEIKNLKQGQALEQSGLLIAFNGNKTQLQNRNELNPKEYKDLVFKITHVWDLFQKNAEAIRLDFEMITKGRTSQLLSDTVTVIGDKNLVFLEKGAKVEACTINVTGGPVYLGQDAEIMEGSMVRGALAMGPHSTLKLGAKIYGATTIGPHCKVGGEMSNSVMLGYSNKGHDGFLGNSVLGEWCNLGADTNTSNLKNNYGPVKLYSYALNKPVDTGLQFCGLIMGDHSKAGINTMFNTGTVCGVACNVYGGGFPATHIPDFSWGGAAGFETYQVEKLFETASRMYERRGLSFGDLDKEILKHLFEHFT